MFLSSFFVFVSVDLVILLLVNSFVSLLILFCLVSVNIWVLVFFLLVSLVINNWLCVCVVIWGRWVIYIICDCLFNLCKSLLMIDVVGLLMFVLILLKIIVGVVWWLFVIIWIVSFIWESLLFDMIFFNLFVFWLGLVDILNFMVFRFVFIGFLSLLYWIWIFIFVWGIFIWWICILIFLFSLLVVCCLFLESVLVVVKYVVCVFFILFLSVFNSVFCFDKVLNLVVSFWWCW